MIGIGIRTLEYEESLSADPPRCLGEVAAALWAGFRLIPATQVNFENVVVGKRRLPQFRDAKRMELTRYVRWHFDGRSITWDGEAMTLRDWVAMWRETPDLRSMVQAHPAYGKWRDGLAANVRRAPLTCLAQEDGRACFGRVGGDPAALADFHRMMEEGW